MNVLEKSAQTEAESRTQLLADYRACLARFETPHDGDETIVRRAMAELRLTEEQVRTHATIVSCVRSVADELAKGPAVAKRVMEAAAAFGATLPALRQARETTRVAREALDAARLEMRAILDRKNSLGALWASPVARLALGEEMTEPPATPEIDQAIAALRELESTERRTLGLST